MADITPTNVNDMEEMKIKFGGQSHQIDANTLINSLIHFTNIVQEINRDLSAELHTEQKVEIKITALAPGSFNVVMDIITSTLASGVSTIFSKDAIKYAADLVKAVGGVYNVAKFLKGNKPKTIETSGNTTKIETINGDVRIFDFRGASLYLNSPTIKEAIAKEFETLEADPNVSNFELLDKSDTPLFESTKADFIAIANNESEELLINEKIKSVKTVLRIISLSWELRKKWDFYYEGIRISAKIKDDTFAKIINAGESFSKGDALEVELDIKQEFDEGVNTYINKAYTVTRIIQHLKRSEQSNIDFPKG